MLYLYRDLCFYSSRASSTTDVATQTEVDELRDEVTDLREQVSMMSSVLKDMQAAMVKAHIPVPGAGTYGCLQFMIHFPHSLFGALFRISWNNQFTQAP
jgi:hypothetical protein